MRTFAFIFIAMHDFFTAISLGFFLAFTIGPVFFVLIETSISKGIRSALWFDVGVILGDILFILIAYFATNNLLNKIKDDPRLFIFGGFLLFVYGIFSLLKEINIYKKNLKTEKISITFEKQNPFHLILKGFLLNAINVGVLGFWLGIIVTFAPRLEMNSQRIFIFFITIITSYFLVDILKILIAKRLREKLTRKNIHQFKKITSWVIILFGGFLILQGFFPNFKEEIILYITSNFN